MGIREFYEIPLYTLNVWVLSIKVIWSLMIKFSLHVKI